jgi:hypothetical protein
MKEKVEADDAVVDGVTLGAICGWMPAETFKGATPRREAKDCGGTLSPVVILSSCGAVSPSTLSDDMVALARQSSFCERCVPRQLFFC